MKMTRAQLPVPLLLCVVLQALYTSFVASQISCTAREMLVGGFVAALAVSALLCGLLLLGQGFVSVPQHAIWKNAVLAVVCLLLIYGMVQTVLQQLQLYYRQFTVGGVWVVLLAALTLGVGASPHALVRCARLLGAIAFGGALLCLLGLAAQSDLQHLSVAALTAQGVSNGFWLGFALLPEYLALLICPDCVGNKNSVKSAIETSGNESDNAQPSPVRGQILLLLLPFFGVVVQAGMVFCSELVFGVPQTGVGGFEVLRSWAFLSFSRFDGVVVLLWVLLGYFRLRFLALLAWQTCPHTPPKQGRKAGQKG